MYRKKFFIFVIILFSLAACKGNAANTARIMSIFAIEGDTVNLIHDNGSEFVAREGTNLFEGNAVSTGILSYCFIALDSDALVKMDEQSLFSVEKVSEKLLSLKIERGQILMDIKRQAPDLNNAFEIRAGNLMLGTRGTLFIVGLNDDDSVYVIMLEGATETDTGEIFPAGTMTKIFDDEKNTTAIVIEELDIFALQAIWDYKGRALEAGAVTPAQLVTVEQLLELYGTPPVVVQNF
ncbi:MAG: FecR family protein, partial [Defluviitaleaceae bacterium]|nr:FecR family protein [Defluviitaleaceae bacterium]